MSGLVLGAVIVGLALSGGGPLRTLGEQPRLLLASMPQHVPIPRIQSIALEPSVLVFGGSTTLAVAAFGGASPLTYVYSGLPPGCASAAVPRLDCLPTLEGEYSINVSVIDLLGHTVSASVNLAVVADSSDHRPLKISDLAITPDPVSVGIPVTIETRTMGGVEPINITYLGLPPGCGGIAGASATCVPTSPGSYVVTASATDAVAEGASASVDLWVSALPTSTFAIEGFVASPDVVALGASETFSASIGGSDGPVTFGYLGLPSGCNSTNSSTLECTPTASGTFEVNVTATDSTHTTARASASFSVAPPSASTFSAASRIGTIAPTFWSVVAQTSCSTCIATNPAVGNFLNTTPFNWIRYGQGADECNVTSSTYYSGTGSVSRPCQLNITAFVRWCLSRTPPCHSILNLPGENNNSAEDAYTASYIVHALHYQPDYWEVGNEPTGWTHYGLPWPKWQSSDHRVPTPVGYAWDVHSAITAVTKVDPTAKFIGIETACECNTNWLSAVARIDGNQIAAIAYHTYPTTAQQETLKQFYAPLASTNNITHSFAKVRAAIAGQCTQCAQLPIFINEYNAGPGWTPSNWGGTYANAVFLAASTVQAIESGVPMLSVFAVQSSSPNFGYSMMNGRGSIGPTGLLYSEILRHLGLGVAFTTHLGNSLPGVYSVLVKNGSREALLVVNTNLGSSLTLSLGLGFPLSPTGHRYVWTPASTVPSIVKGLLSKLIVPAQSILLLTTN
ncbi:MAG TPA: hypothetical protein VFF67_09410 [Thermoplasmata archaeon]|nr:hypothetical protein [Thermoplasmata archaeon]